MCGFAIQDGGRAVSLQPLSESAVSLLLLLGFHAYHDAQLLTQLARIFRHMTLSNTILFASPVTIKEAYERASMVSHCPDQNAFQPIGITVKKVLLGSVSRQPGRIQDAIRCASPRMPHHKL